MTTRSRALGALLGLVTLLGCDGEGARVGGHTNWLPCESFADCAANSEAAACTDGYCVDVSGERLPAASSVSQDGGASIDAAPDEGTATDGADEGRDEAGDAEASRDAQALDAAAGRDAQALDAAADGDSQALDAAADRDSRAPDADLGGEACGPTICPTGARCCDVCLGICVPELSGAFCPNGPGTLCNDGGVAELRIPACPGPMERCASERCLEGMGCVSCPASQLCLELDLSCGPAGGSTAQCIDWPCGDGSLNSGCAEAICRSVEPSGLFYTANVYPEGSFPLRPGDASFVGCAGGGVCAAPNTPIATPRGEVPIADLRPGDMVYSLHAGRLSVVPVLAVARTPVYRHRVVRLVLEGGARLEISAPHPLASGRLLGTLEAGETIDGRTIIASEIVDYEHAYTHDILPASDSGTYLAGGLWLGSTLF